MYFCNPDCTVAAAWRMFERGNGVTFQGSAFQGELFAFQGERARVRLCKIAIATTSEKYTFRIREIQFLETNPIL